MDLTRRALFETATAAVAATRLAAQTNLEPAQAPASSSNGASTPPVPPNRQVHLDFHTSELIPGIGERFDKSQWQAALRSGHVNHINIFAKGHHGWSYYPTQVGHTHPNLKFDLLGAQIAACHEIGVNCPIYFTIGWAANDAETHPEWCVRSRDGAYTANEWDFKAKPSDPRPHTSWKYLCAAASGPYHAMILRQVEEICQRYPLDGFWFDIYNDHDCYCEACVRRMKTEGVDPADTAAVVKSYVLSIREHMRQVRFLVARHHLRASVYFNSATHVGDSQLFKLRLFDFNSQQELEDLPTTWGGYDKLPIEAKYHLGQGSRVVAMSGKFHKSWGEFGGFKAPEAIRYEAAAMISNGVACNFGDQLHPCGEMDVATYSNIGYAYTYVEKIEEYGPGGLPYSKLGVWLTLDFHADRGVVNMLLEMHYDFVPADERNLDSLSTLVVPSLACLSDSQAAAISAWVKRGGNLIVLEAGALDEKKTRFVLDVGADYAGPSEYQFDYTVVKAALGKNVVSTPFLNYQAGVRTKPTTGQVLAVIREPYFNRTYAHYSSHANTPYKLEDSVFPAVVRNGNTIFFAHPLDRLYYASAVRLHRELFKNAIDQLDAAQVLRVTGLPSSGRVSLLRQAAKRRYVAHLLYSPALQRGDVNVIEDFPPIPGVQLAVRVPERVTKVRTVPANETLAFTQNDGVLALAVPTFTMHTGVVLEY